MISTPKFFFLSLLSISLLFTTRAVAQGVFEQSTPPLPLQKDEGSLAFEHERMSFAPQSVGIENCANIAINNTTDHPRLLTELRTLDRKHFYVTSPAREMLPLTIGANTTFYLNLCFKADEPKAFESELVAIFQSDTIHMKLAGRGVPAPEVMPVPKTTEITNVKYKKHQWTFEFALNKRGAVHLILENMLGKAVKTFPFDEVKTPGYYQVNFDGKSDLGKKLEKGSYILRLEVSDQQTMTKLHASRLINIK